VILSDAQWTAVMLALDSGTGGLVRRRGGFWVMPGASREPEYNGQPPERWTYSRSVGTRSVEALIDKGVFRDGNPAAVGLVPDVLEKAVARRERVLAKSGCRHDACKRSVQA